MPRSSSSCACGAPVVSSVIEIDRPPTASTHCQGRGIRPASSSTLSARPPPACRFAPSVAPFRQPRTATPSSPGSASSRRRPRPRSSSSARPTPRRGPSSSSPSLRRCALRCRRASARRPSSSARTLSRPALFTTSPWSTSVPSSSRSRPALSTLTASSSARSSSPTPPRHPTSGTSRRGSARPLSALRRRRARTARSARRRGGSSDRAGSCTASCRPSLSRCAIASGHATRATIRMSSADSCASSCALQSFVCLKQS